MKLLPESISDARHLMAGILLADIALALTFLQTARVSQVEATILRNQENARKAYNSTVHFLSTQDFNQSERESIEEKLAGLRDELEAMGQTLWPRE